MSDHSRLFLEVQTVWDELHSWKKALRLDAVRIYIGGQSLYRLLGPGMRSNNAVRGYIIKDGWLRNHTEPPTTKLISVKSLTVIASKAIQIWPAIVGCAIAESLPNLEELRLFDMDWDKKWWLLRSELRDGDCYCSVSFLAHITDALDSSCTSYHDAVSKVAPDLRTSASFQVFNEPSSPTAKSSTGRSRYFEQITE